jgi:hypothetical protein
MNGYTVALVFTACLRAGFATAHEGHDDVPKVSAAKDAAPRSEAQTDLFELVAVPGNGQLTIFLDRFASNEPLSDAKVEVESGNWKAVALAAGNGIYRVNAPQFANPGSYPLQLSVQAGADADLIATTLVVAEPANSEAGAASHGSGWIWWSVGGLAALGASSLLLKRRRPGRLGAAPQQENRVEK